MNHRESIGDALAVVDTDGEWRKVEAWRLEKLLEAGFPVIIAEQLAADPRVDHRRAIELVRRGCKYATAAEILL